MKETEVENMDTNRKEGKIKKKEKRGNMEKMGRGKGRTKRTIPNNSRNNFDRRGDELSDVYEIDRYKLGKGSYGNVVKAVSKRTGQQRAIKIIEKKKIHNIERLKREILIMKQMDHPNIIKLYEVYEDNEKLYLVLELCDGGELFDKIVKYGSFSEYEAYKIMKQIFSALYYCHSKNIMHRDLKPENILYVDNTEDSPIQIIDWGFASKCMNNHNLKSVVGTPYYIAPEILRVEKGEFVFDSNYWARVSDDAKDLICQCLNYNYKERIDVEQVLKHRWFKKFKSNNLIINKTLNKTLIEKFKEFHKLCKIKKLAVTCIAYQLNEKDIGKLKKTFEAFDHNGDGVLTISEIFQCLKVNDNEFDRELYFLLKQLDTDGNGLIDYTEFLAACLDHSIFQQDVICRNAFNVFDLDGDGVITKDELFKILSFSAVQVSFSKEIIENLIKEVDSNNDGFIDYDEFYKMMTGVKE
ncbi:CAMK/CDPK protein kinase [Plasmodium falciparum RAJ116]|uniref:non-specific serine/threonine protein kinase n=1 Tax=Plasmodium falciparum RAJ116 TaxID=580058 RepID=A0A0L0CX63_PLAFA|nr:CAMK/CDPK protein kinase [Plasmodium falciparum RAJ116]